MKAKRLISILICVVLFVSFSTFSFADEDDSAPYGRTIDNGFIYANSYYGFAYLLSGKLVPYDNPSPEEGEIFSATDKEGNFAAVFLESIPSELSAWESSEFSVWDYLLQDRLASAKYTFKDAGFSSVEGNSYKTNFFGQEIWRQDVSGQFLSVTFKQTCLFFKKPLDSFYCTFCITSISDAFDSFFDGLIPYVVPSSNDDAIVGSWKRTIEESSNAINPDRMVSIIFRNDGTAYWTDSYGNEKYYSWEKNPDGAWEDGTIIYTLKNTTTEEESFLMYTVEGLYPYSENLLIILCEKGDAGNFTLIRG